MLHAHPADVADGEELQAASLRDGLEAYHHLCRFSLPCDCHTRTSAWHLSDAACSSSSLGIIFASVSLS